MSTTPFDRTRYDTRPTLSDAERADLVRIDACRFFRQTTERERLAWRLYVPVRDALAHGGASTVERTIAWGAFVDHTLALDRPGTPRVPGRGAGFIEADIRDGVACGRALDVDWSQSLIYSRDQLADGASKRA